MLTKEHVLAKTVSSIEDLDTIADNAEKQKIDKKKQMIQSPFFQLLINRLFILVIYLPILHIIPGRISESV